MKKISLIALTFALLGVASARAERVAVNTFEVLGKNSEATHRQLRDGLIQGLAAAGFAVVSSEEMTKALRGSNGLSGCTTPACVRQVGELTGANYIVQGSIETLGNSNYVFVVQLLDTRDGQPTARIDDHCDVCSLADAKQALVNAAAELKRKTAVSVVPIDRTIKPALISPPVSKPISHRRPLRIAAVALAVVGLPVLACGGALWGVDGLEYTHKTSTDGTMKIIQNWDTLAIGIPLTVVGVAMLGTAIGLFVHDEAVRNKTSVAVISLPGGGMFTLDAPF